MPNYVQIIIFRVCDTRRELGPHTYHTHFNNVDFSCVLRKNKIEVCCDFSISCTNSNMFHIEYENNTLPFATSFKINSNKINQNAFPKSPFSCLNTVCNSLKSTVKTQNINRSQRNELWTNIASAVIHHEKFFKNQSFGIDVKLYVPPLMYKIYTHNICGVRN